MQRNTPYADSIFNFLNEAVLLSKESKFHKLLHAKFICSLFLEKITSWFSHPINVMVKTFWGENMLVVIPELVSIVIYRYGFYEEGLSNIFLRYLKPGMTFFDVGAHFGYFTLLGSTLVGAQGQVHAFEPTPSTFNILKQNALRKDNVKINNNALFSENKDLLLKDYGIRYSAFNSIFNSKLDKKTLQTTEIAEHTIKGITIDDYVEGNKAIPSFIKIDAESSEYDILLGGQKTIEKYHPLITIEVGDTGFEEMPESRELIEYLFSKNYLPFNYADGEIKAHSLKSDRYRYDNILFVPDNQL
jgi:FkbM family methyltransferase